MNSMVSVVSMKRQPVQSEEMSAFIGIDYHKAYSIYSVLDAQGSRLGQGRIDHAHPEDFRALARRWPGCHVVFEAGMNWHWLFEILEMELSSESILLANPFKTRIIAEAQIKADKVDARILADLLRGRLVPSVHIAGRQTRQIRDVLRQRCFFRPPAHDAAQSHSSSAWRSARSEVAAMQRPLRPQGPELPRKAGASSAGQTPN
jgi:hypothetical protein